MATAPVNFGLIGLGPFWESRYRPALAKLEPRLKVVGVYDNVLSRADQAARETHSRVVEGITALVDRPDVQALLWLEAGWQGSTILGLLCDRRKPVLMAARCPLSLPEWQQVREQVAAHGLTIFPAFPKRCTPASNRLQELLATQLGQPLRIDVSISPASLEAVPFATEADFGGVTPPPEDPLLDWTDWTQYLFRALPQEVIRRGDGQGWRLDFAPLSSSGNTEPRIAELSLSPAPPVADQPTLDEVRLQCERGEARILGSCLLEWTVDGVANSESLTAERTETEVLLDHFCRRVVGGLIPVPDLGDLCRAKQVLSESTV